MSKERDKHIDDLNDLVSCLQKKGLDADDLEGAVCDEKKNEADLLIEEGLMSVCEYLIENGWHLEAIRNEARQEKAQE